jgi:hypothetical protein
LSSFFIVSLLLSWLSLVLLNLQLFNLFLIISLLIFTHPISSFIYMYIYIYTHTHTHTHTHTYGRFIGPYGEYIDLKIKFLHVNTHTHTHTHLWSLYRTIWWIHWFEDKNFACEYCGTLFGFKNNFLPHHITTQEFWLDVSMEF